MGCHAYVAKKYDVDFHQWIHWDEFNSLLNAWEDLYAAYCPGDLSYATDEYNNWYEFEKPQLQKLLEVLKTFKEYKGALYPPEVDPTDSEYAGSAYRPDVRDMLEEMLMLAENMNYVRVEFD